MHSSIRWRLTVWYVIVLAATLLLLGGATFLLMQAALYDWMDDALRERAESLAARVQLVGPDRHPYLPGQPRDTGEEAADGIALLDAGGRIVHCQRADPDLLVRATAVSSALRGLPRVAVALSGGDR